MKFQWNNDECSLICLGRTQKWMNKFQCSLFSLCDPFMLFGTGWTLPVFIFWSLNCWWLTMTQRFMVAIRCGPGKCSRKSRTMALDGFLCFCVRDFNHHLSCALCQFLVEIEWCQALHEYLTNHESCSRAMHWRCSANNKNESFHTHDDEEWREFRNFSTISRHFSVCEFHLCHQESLHSSQCVHSMNDGDETRDRAELQWNSISWLVRECVWALGNMKSI